MSLKPVNQRSALETRNAIWTAVRKLRIFAVADIRAKTHCTADTIREYTACLLNGGFLIVHAEKGPGAPTIYELIRDNGVEAPRLRRDGSEVTQGRAQEQMWRAMRILGTFTPRELAVNATTEEVPVAEEAAKSYIMYVSKAGYITMVTPPKPGSRYGRGAQARYRFLATRYTGPRPLQVQRVKQVFDPNIGKVVWKGGDDDAA